LQLSFIRIQSNSYVWVLPFMGTLVKNPEIEGKLHTPLKKLSSSSQLSRCNMNTSLNPTHHSNWRQAAPLVNWSMKIGSHRDNISIYEWVNFCGMIMKNRGDILLQWFWGGEIRTCNNPPHKLIVSSPLGELEYEDNISIYMRVHEKCWAPIINNAQSPLSPIAPILVMLFGICFVVILMPSLH
jgi:hypothetical protein